MIRAKISLAVGLGLIALLAAAPGANAKHGKPPLPDLVVGRVSKPPSSIVAGSTMAIKVTLRNKGRVKAGKSRVGLYLATGKKHKPKDRRLERAKVKALRPHKRAKAKLSVVLPTDSTPGAYRLIACADDGRRLHESKERDNCHASKPFTLTSRPSKTPQPNSAARPAFSMTDGLDWGFVQDASGKTPGPGNPVTATLTAANGLAGQAGYVRSSVGGQPLLSGPATTFNFNVTSSSEDDGAVTTGLPFAFPFGGVDERSISVSTNGWISFGSPAWDYWDDAQPFDYRGVKALVGTVDRGIMPYWDDLDVGEPNAGDGTVKMVVPADGSAVAFQWDLGQHSGGGTPRRVFQLVLFPDGRFRFDYPGANASGGNEAFIGYSLGAGPASADVVAANVEAVPTTSLLFTPNSVPAAGALPVGQATVTLPAGSSFLSGGAGCTVALAPGPFTQGLASCPVPGLASGQQATQTVTFAMPPKAPGESRPANFRLLGSYLSGGFALAGGNEIDALTRTLRNAKINVTPSYTSPPAPEVGKPALFTTQIQATTGGLDEPSATFTLPANATFDSVKISGQEIDCGPPSGGQVSCKLPSGTSSTSPVVTVTPTAAGTKMKLVVSAQALNAPLATGEVESPVVVP